MRKVRRVARIIVGMYWLFALWLVAIVIVHEILNAVDFRPREDAWLLFTTSAVISISVVIMLIQTRRWTVMALGILGLIAFDAGLYGLTSSSSIWNWHTTTQSDFNWLRADLFVSAPMMFYAQIEYAAKWLARCRRERRAIMAQQKEGS